MAKNSPVSISSNKLQLATNFLQQSRLEFLYQHFFLLLIFGVGLFLRMRGTLNGLFTFALDQGRDFLDLYALVYQKELQLIGSPAGMEGVFHGVWWHWLLAPVFLVFHGDPRAVLLVFNFITALIIPLVFILGKKMHSQLFGLLLSVLVAISPYFISTATHLWQPHIVPLLTVLLLIQLWDYLQVHQLFWIGVLLGFIFEFEVGYGMYFVPACLVTLVLSKQLPTKKQLLYGCLGFLSAVLPRILFDVQHNFLQFNSFMRSVLNQPNGAAPLLLHERLTERFFSFFSIFTDSFAGGNLLVSVLLCTVIVLYLISLVKQGKKDRITHYMLFLWLLIVVLFVISSLYPAAFWTYDLVGLPVILLPIIGMSLLWVLNTYRFSGVAIIVLLGIFAVRPFSSVPPAIEENMAYKNQLGVVNAILADAQGKEFNVAVYSPTLIDYSYTYLFLWYGMKEYQRVPETELKNIVFFVIEPEKWNPAVQAAWLRERQEDGVVEWQKEFPGGILVQRRNRAIPSRSYNWPLQ